MILLVSPASESRRRLHSAEIDDALKTLPGWSLASGKLHRTYRFRDFKQAFAWMTMAALAAEKANHHPDWSNSYKDVTVDLVTHDAGGITRKDIELARAFEDLAEPILGPEQS
jgi:4a-hydroxytetrahydrobiopterin dehydratase